MAEIKIDFDRILGSIKPMHAVNNGPVKPKRMFSKTGNFEAYKEASIPYARNHDAAFCASYGGEHTVDINAIFPNFDADVNDPASYDFACTDFYTQSILEAGTKVFYRLGNKIDLRIKKYDSKPPKDFNKWAQICEHIIAHYNEGWADGFHYNIEYWEIWNEPENGSECWDGPYEDFLVLFTITAKHLKKRFPNIKVGGPAFATGGTDKRKDAFLQYMKERDVPLDFFSWHTYRSNTEEYKKRILAVRESLDNAGYTNTESILDEWNYIINWHDGLKESKKAIISMKGAAFVAAVMATGQATPLDMLMYYDARPCALNCLFDFYTSDPLKGYFVFKLFAELYSLGKHAMAVSDADDIYVVAATNDTAKALMVTYFTNDKEAQPKTVALSFADAKDDCYTTRLLDDDNDATPIETLCVKNGIAELTMQPNTVIFLSR